MSEEFYERIAGTLGKLPLPHSSESPLSRNLVESISCHDDKIRVLLRFDTLMNEGDFAHYCAQLEAALRQEFPTHHVRVLPFAHHSPQPLRAPKPQDSKRFGGTPVLVVGSGKGGVGKSSVAYSLAKNFVSLGYRVRFVDADIYGPSLPTILTDDGIALSLPLPHFEHVSSHQGQLVSSSIGYYVDPYDALIWRGPMLAKALDMILFGHQWPDTDLVIVDLPPGTGDVILSLAKSITITGCLVVTTPHNISLGAVNRFLKMSQTLQLPLLGIVSNMHQEPQNSEALNHFAQNWHTHILAQIPFVNPLDSLAPYTMPLAREVERTVLKNTIPVMQRQLP